MVLYDDDTNWQYRPTCKALHVNTHFYTKCLHYLLLIAVQLNFCRLICIDLKLNHEMIVIFATSVLGIQDREGWCDCCNCVTALHTNRLG